MSARRGTTYGGFAVAVRPFVTKTPKTAREVAEEMGGGFTTNYDLVRVKAALNTLYVRRECQRRGGATSAEAHAPGAQPAYVYWRE